MKTLLIAGQAVDDLSYGGGLRSAAIARALGSQSEAHTLVVRKGTPIDGTGPERAGSFVLQYQAANRADQVRALREIRRRIEGLMDREGYSVIVARYLTAALMVPPKYRHRTIMDADDIVKRIDAESGPLRGLTGRLRSLVVAGLLRRFAHVWFVSPADQTQWASRARRSSLLPNITPRHNLPAARRRPGRLLMVGHYGHGPNRDAVDFLITEVLPQLGGLDGIELHVVGAAPQQEWRGRPGVVVRGFVPDLGAEYASAALAVAPVQSGGGTQLKAIEAVVNGCPLVVSEFTYRGLQHSLERQTNLLVAESPVQWAHQVGWVLAHPEQAQEIADRARAKVADEYSAERFGRVVGQTMEEVAALGCAPGSGREPDPAR